MYKYSIHLTPGLANQSPHSSPAVDPRRNTAVALEYIEPGEAKLKVGEAIKNGADLPMVVS